MQTRVVPKKVAHAVVYQNCNIEGGPVGLVLHFMGSSCGRPLKVIDLKVGEPVVVTVELPSPCHSHAIARE